MLTAIGGGGGGGYNREDCNFDFGALRYFLPAMTANIVFYRDNHRWEEKGLVSKVVRQCTLFFVNSCKQRFPRTKNLNIL